MKRTKTILAEDESTKVSVVIKIDDNQSLTRDEINNLASGLADSVMSSLSTARYLNVYMSDIQVK